MIDWLVYGTAATVVGGLLALVVAMFKVGPGKPEFSFLRCLGLCLLLTWGGPFAYVEAMTRSKGPELRKAVHDWYEKDPSIDGKLVGQKVLACGPKGATVLVIGSERAIWGTDRPIVRLRLERKGAGWAVAETKVLRSSRLDKDEFIFPPYQ